MEEFFVKRRFGLRAHSKVTNLCSVRFDELGEFLTKSEEALLTISWGWTKAEHANRNAARIAETRTHTLKRS